MLYLVAHEEQTLGSYLPKVTLGFVATSTTGVGILNQTETYICYHAYKPRIQQPDTHFYSKQCSKTKDITGGGPSVYIDPVYVLSNPDGVNFDLQS